MSYYQVYGKGSTIGPREKPELLDKIENWKKGVVVAKGTRARHVLPVFSDRHLADTISTQGRHGVTWLPQNVEIIPMDHQTSVGSGAEGDHSWYIIHSGVDRVWRQDHEGQRFSRKLQGAFS